MSQNHNTLFVCFSSQGDEIELHYLRDEHLHEVAGMIEMFSHYRTFTGTVFHYPQEVPGHQCITLAEFMECHQDKVVSWVISHFSKQHRQAVA